MSTYKIEDVVSVKPFKGVIDLTEDLKDPKWKDILIPYYIVTEDVRKVFEEILETITGIECSFDNQTGTVKRNNLRPTRRFMHLVTAGFGTGKSYLMLVLSKMLESADKDEFVEKFKEYTCIQEQLRLLEKKRYFPVRISAEAKGDWSFKYLIIEHLKQLLEEQFGIVPKIVQTEFDRAVSHINKMKSDSALQGTYSDFESFVGGTAAVVDMIKGLKSLDEEVLEKYYETCEKVFRKVDRHEGTDLIEILKAASDFLRTKRFDGIVIYIQEFTAYLRSSMEHDRLSTDLGTLQGLYSLCGKYPFNVFFVAEMHERLDPIIAKKLSDEEFKKVRGRFEDHSLGAFQYGKLIEGMLTHKEETIELAIRNVKDKWDQINSLCLKYQNKDLKRGQTPYKYNLINFYPFHPAVVRHIPFVSRGVAERERSTFRFIQEKMEDKKNEPIIGTDGKLNIVTLDEVFDWFTKDITGKEDLLSAYNSALETCSEDELAKRVLKTLVTLFMASSVSAPEIDVEIESKANENDLALYLNHDNVEEIKASMKRLEGSDFIDKDMVWEHYRDIPYYYFRVAGLPQIDEKEIETEMNKITPKEALEEQLTQIPMDWDTCIDQYDTWKFKIHRRFNCNFCSIRELAEKVEFSIGKGRAGQVGTIIYIVPDFEVTKNGGDISYDKSKAYSLAQKRVNSNYVVAVPKNVTWLSETDFRRRLALMRLRNDYDRNGEVLKVKALDKLLKPLENRIKNAVEKFGDAGNFIFVTSFGDFREKLPEESNDEYMHHLIEYVFEEYFPDFPKFQGDKITSRTPINTLIKTLISPTEVDETLNISRRTWKYIEDIMIPLGLAHRLVHEKVSKVRLISPMEAMETDNIKKSRKIWNIIDQKIERSDSNSKPITTVYNELMAPPYGLDDYLIELYLAAYVGLGNAEVRDLYGKIVCKAKRLDKMNIITDSKDWYYFVKTRALLKEEREYVRNIWSLFNDKHFDKIPLEGAVDLEDVWETLKKDLAELSQRINESIKNISIFLEGDKSGINDLIEFSVYIQEASTIPEPIKGIDRLENIPKLFLENKEKGHADKCYLKFKWFLDIFTKFSQNYEKLESLKEKMIELKNVEEYEEISLKKELAKAKLSKKEDLVFDGAKQEEFLRLSDQFWKSYVANYDKEHKATSQLARNFGKKDILESVAFVLLEELSKLKFEGIVQGSTIKNEIETVHLRKCDFDASKEMKIPEKFEGLQCPKCEYKLGNKEFIEKDLTRRDIEVKARVAGAIRKFFNKLLEIDADFATYPENDRVKEWKRLTDIIRENEDIIKLETDEQVTKLSADSKKVVEIIALLTKLTDTINRYLSRPIGKKLPVQIVSLEEFTEGFVSYIKSQGMMNVSVEDFEGYLSKWTTEFKKKFGRNCQIKVI